MGRGWGLEETGPTLGWDWRRQAPPSGGIGGPQDQSAGGRMTVSMTWMTPFDAITSGVTTLALSFR